MREHLGLETPDAPPSDYDTFAVINTFYLAGRSRSFLGTMTIQPMALTVRDITDVLCAHPVEICREILDSCVFALDDLYLSEANSKHTTNDDTEDGETTDTEG